MRYDELFIAGLGSYLPKAIPVDEAIAAGTYDADEQARTGQQTVTVCGPDDSQPDMAVRAGRVAIERSGYEGQIALLLHAVSTYSGLDSWNAPCYIQQELLQSGALSFEVRQQCNGGVASIELAAAYLAAMPGRQAALITASECFEEPVWDRWRSTWGLVLGDGASAAVLSRTGGFARVLSAVTVTDAELEAVHRGNLPFTPSPDISEYPIDLRARNLEYELTADHVDTSRRVIAGVCKAAHTAADEAGVGVLDADHYVLPNFGKAMLTKEFLEPLGIPIERTTWEWGMRIGHMGAAGQYAALSYLSETGRLKRGQHIFVMGVGAGFNWTCLVLEVLKEPSWAY